jgi:hypothetical protein
MSRLTTTDPMERLIEVALQKAGIRYVSDEGEGVPEHLDFYLPDHGIFIEVKRMHSPRIADQMSRAANVIAVQGLEGVRFMAALLAGKSA